MPSNRIEVDLKLLQDKNLQVLSDFGKQFDKSVQALGMVLGDYASQITGAISASNVAGSGGVGPSASVASNVRIGGGQARMGGQPPTGQSSPGFANAPASAYGGGGSASSSQETDQQYGPPPGRNPGSEQGYIPFERQYVQASRRIGEIPVGLRQVFGYMSEGQLPFLQKPPKDASGNPLLDANGNAVPAGYTLNEEGQAVPGRMMEVGGHISDWMFAQQAIGQNVSLMNQHLSDARNFIIGNALYGQNLGYSRAGGLFGTPLGSPAFNVALSNQFATMQAANFGLDLSYSPQQAQQAMQAITNYGWSGSGTTDWMLNFIKHQQNQGITPDTVMALLDPYLRFGGSEGLTQIHNTLNGIAQAAKAANIPLSEFQQQIVSTAQGISQATGGTVTSAAGALAAFSSVTGVAPERAQELLSDPHNLLLASAMTGESVWQVSQGQNSMQAMQSFGAMQFANSVGNLTPQQIQQGLKAPRNSAAYQQANAVMSRATVMWSNNPQIFGGMSPREWLNAGLRAGSWKGIGQRESVMQKLNSLNTSHDVNFQSLIQKYAGSNTKYAYQLETGLSKDFETWMKGGAMRNGVSYSGNTQKDLEEQRQHKLNYLLQQLNQQNQKHARQAQKQVTIGLSQTAQKWFRLMNSEYGRGGGKAKSNRWTQIEDYGRSAMNLVEHPIDAAEDVVSSIWNAL